MFSQPLQDLIERFLKFPGVGPRQAVRFVFYLLREDQAAVRELAEAVTRLRETVKLCEQCYKTFNAEPDATQARCELCRHPQRNARQVLVVEKEVDLDAVERTRTYLGLYHVLGGTVSPLDSSAPGRLHIRELFERVKALTAAGGNEPLEVILATNPTAEGDATALYLERVLAPLKDRYPALALSRLGRGLSTGSELEYADEVTIANALLNRK